MLVSVRYATRNGEVGETIHRVPDLEDGQLLLAARTYEYSSQGQNVFNFDIYYDQNNNQYWMAMQPSPDKPEGNGVRKYYRIPEKNGADTLEGAWESKRMALLGTYAYQGILLSKIAFPHVTLKSNTQWAAALPQLELKHRMRDRDMSLVEYQEKIQDRVWVKNTLVTSDLLQINLLHPEYLAAPTQAAPRITA